MKSITKSAAPERPAANPTTKEVLSSMISFGGVGGGVGMTLKGDNVGDADGAAVALKSMGEPLGLMVGKGDPP